jgi:hypothetical protein
MRVVNWIKVYEIDGVEERVAELTVHSHHISKEKVILEFDNKKVTVWASDLQDAIVNAKNRGR